MDLKEYLTDTFNYNSVANKKLLEKIRQLPDKSASKKLFSHLINSQYKWMARIMKDPKAPEMSWWDPVYQLDQLEAEWDKSLQPWIDYIRSMTEEALCTEVTFTGFDGGTWAAPSKDIAIQLNNHSIHHRAQMQTLIRQQGLEPDFLDYIGTKYRKLG